MQRLTVDDLVLAEAVRVYEHALDQPRFNDSSAVAVALREIPNEPQPPHPQQPGADDRDAATFLTRRIVVRARNLPIASELQKTIAATRSRLRAIIFIGLIIGVIVGGLAARAALHDQTANIAALIFGLLGVQTVLLLLWLGIMVIAAGRS
ncbi:MAG: hypothetical protein ACR2GY_00655, partial [Phycisphaerales bacterium]